MFSELNALDQVQLKAIYPMGARKLRFAITYSARKCFLT